MWSTVLVSLRLRSFLECGTFLSKPGGVGHSNQPPEQYKDQTTEASNNIHEAENIKLTEWNLQKSSYSMVPFIWSSELSYKNRSRRVYAFEGLADGKEVWGTFWCDGNVLYFGRNLGYIGVCAFVKTQWMISWNFCIPAFKNTCKQNWTIVNDIHSNILITGILEWGVTLPSLSGMEFPKKCRDRGKENKTLRTAPEWNCMLQLYPF